MWVATGGIRRYKAEPPAHVIQGVGDSGWDDLSVPTSQNCDGMVEIIPKLGPLRGGAGGDATTDEQGPVPADKPVISNVGPTLTDLVIVLSRLNLRGAFLVILLAVVYLASVMYR